MTCPIPRHVAPLLLALLTTACGGAPPAAETAREAATPAAATHLTGLHASDITKTLRERGLACGEPQQQRGTMHWTCEVATPLMSYSVDLYGKAPGRLEYIKAVVTQSSQPTTGRALDLFEYVAGLGYEGADPSSARAWVESHLESGGQTMIGPAKCKVSGNLSRLVLEIKAPGSEW